MSVLRTKSLGRWYGQVAGLSDLSVEVGSGITGLIGPNGAGKSTLLKLIVGELRPSRGQLEVLGHAPFANRALYRRLGFAPQQDAFYGHLNAVEMVILLLRLHGFGKNEAREKAAHALARVRLLEGTERPIRTYSKGMRQRVKLAQAIAHDPEFLVLDEPLTGLDPLGRRDVLQLLKELAEEGKTVLVSSHVLYEVESLDPKVLLIHRGRLLAQGKVREIRKLLNRHPSRVLIESREPRVLGKALFELDEVNACRLDEKRGSLDIETRDLEGFLERATQVCAAGGYGISSMKTVDEGLEAVFDYLVQ